MFLKMELANSIRLLCVDLSPSSSGFVGGIRLTGGQQHRLGDGITAEVIVKNSSDQVKMFAYSFSAEANLRAFDGDKSIAELNYSHFTGIPVTMHYRLEPNQVALVGSFKIGLHDPEDKQNGLPKATFQIPCRAGQALTLRCDMSANVFGSDQKDNLDDTKKNGPAATGTLSLTVLPQSFESNATNSQRDPESQRVEANKPLSPVFILPDFLNVRVVGFSSDNQKLVSVATKEEVTIRTWSIADKQLVSEIKLDRTIDGADPLHCNQFLMSGFRLSQDLRRLVGCVQNKALFGSEIVMCELESQLRLSPLNC